MRNDPSRRALADLRETCAAVLDARTDLPQLFAQHLAASRLAPLANDPVAEALERALPFFSGDLPLAKIQEPLTTPPEWAETLIDGVVALRPGGLSGACVLDPCAGSGEIVAAVLRRGVGSSFAYEARLLPYYRAAARLGGVGGLCFANPFLLPEREPTPAFDFAFDENAERVARSREVEADVVLGDFRHAFPRPGRATSRARAAYGATSGRLPPMLRWATDRLRGADGRARDGVVAFVSDEEFVDAPSLAGMRAALEREFGHIAHLALEGAGITFLARGAGRRTLYASDGASSYEGANWRELQPTEAHVWRTEILREEWPGFVPLDGRGGLFERSFEGASGSRDAFAPEDRRARRVLRRPYVEAWRRPERGAAWPEGPCLVVVREPFGAFVSDAFPDRRCAGPVALFERGAISSSALARFRIAYGPGVTSHDAFDYAVALLHHPEYRERYHEDLRRGLPRLPFLRELDGLQDLPGAPPVGPGTAYGTGWSPPDLFEPGTVPDYDDPFASPYARADVEPGFLLFAGLGAALARVRTQSRHLRHASLERIETADLPFERMRLSRDRTRVLVHRGLTLSGIPPEVFEDRIGAKSALEWVVEGLRPRGGFLPDAEAAVRTVGQVVAASVETNRLVRLVGQASLQT